MNAKTGERLMKLRSIIVAYGATPGEEAAAKAAIARILAGEPYSEEAAVDSDIARILDLLQRSMAVRAAWSMAWDTAAAWVWMLAVAEAWFDHPHWRGSGTSHGTRATKMRS